MEDKNKKSKNLTDPSKGKKANAMPKKEEIDPRKLKEPITERVSKKIPKRKPLGPSGQEWDI